MDEGTRDLGGGRLLGCGYRVSIAFGTGVIGLGTCLIWASHVMPGIDLLSYKVHLQSAVDVWPPENRNSSWAK
jgi:hypothetical protein